MLSSYETRHAHLPQAIVPLPIERHVGPGHDERVDRQPYHGDLAVPSWRGPQASAGVATVCPRGSFAAPPQHADHKSGAAVQDFLPRLR